MSIQKASIFPDTLGLWFAILSPLIGILIGLLLAWGIAHV